MPTISSQPAAVSRTTGQSVTFSVTASAPGASAGDITYQWRRNGTDISGATASSHTIASATTADAGTYSVVVRNSGASAAVSSVTSADAVLTMSQGSQTITFGTISDKTYGDSAFTVTATASSGLPVSFTSTTTGVCTVAGSTVTIVSTGTCTVTASQTGNMDWLAATDVQRQFTVNAKVLTITGMTAQDKTYDTTTSATPSFGSAALNGVVPGDSVTIVSNGAAASFATASAGSGIIVTASGVTLGGTHAARYSLTQPTATAAILRKSLTVNGTVVSNKVYDGTTSATSLLNFGSALLGGVISGTTVNLESGSATAVFDNKNVGTGKTVTVTGLTLSGTHAGNYVITQPTATADITAKTLTVTGITAANKTYDASRTATVTANNPAFVGVESGDTVTINVASITGLFDTKNIGTTKTVQIAG
ncbi:MAG: hypothetical protein EBT79_14310, partial [Actinobacteria bacterium]|nr:hypothetical protein [Actinomycetota bacterium]